MNSESLRKKFSKVYEDFFSRSPIIVSAPACFVWAGDYSVMEGGFALIQKLPLHSYVGIEANSAGSIEINSFKYLETAPQGFVESELENSTKLNLLKYISSYLKDNGLITGVKINILSEIPPGHGLNMSGAVSVALATALNLYIKKIKLKDVENWKNVELSTLTKKIELKFDSTFRVAWKLGSIFHGGVSSGASAFTPFIYSPYPVVFLTERRAKIRNANECYADIRFPKDTTRDWKVLDQVYYTGIRMEELFDYKFFPQWPIDFGILYSGEPRMTATSSITMEEVKDTIKEASDLVNKEFAVFLENSPVTIYFYDLVKRCGWHGLWHIYIEPMMVAGLELLKAFKHLFYKGTSEKAIKNVMSGINRSMSIFKMLNLVNQRLEDMGNFLSKELIKLNDPYGVGYKPLGAGRNGDLLFVTGFHSLQHQFGRVLDEMRKAIDKNIFLDYASWIDGIEEEGVKVEQHLEEKIYSNYISGGAVLVEHLNSSGFRHEDLYSHEEFQKAMLKADLVFDDVDGLIYIKGKQLSSKQLHSTTATIEILKILLGRAGEYVPNSALPQSTYTADRNELQSKIISPLTKAVRSKTKRDLSLKISGGITHFTLRLDKEGMNIFLVKKIF